MTTLTDTQVITASGGLVELGRVINANSVTITSTTGQTACGPLTVVCDGSPILVEYFCSEVSTQATAGNYAAFELHEDGAQRVGFWGVVKTPASASMSVPVHLQRVLTPSAGSHTYEVQAFVNAGTASAFSGTDASTTSAAPATLRVSKIVQATQWPAVTTGTIICTSSTRPSAPFEGQTIYETDTNLSLIYDGSAWVSPQVVDKPPAVHVYRTSDRTSWVGGNYDTYTTAGVNTDGMWNPAATDRVTVQTAGLYQISVGSYIYSTTATANATTGLQSFIEAVIGGTAHYVAGGQGAPGNGGTFSTTCLSVTLNLGVGDYIRSLTYSNGGTGTNLALKGAATQWYTFISATLVGKA